MVTAVLFVNHASPTTITQFHDILMNQTPETLPSWEFELGIFLNNKASKPINMNENTQIPNRYLYTLQLSYLNNERGGNRMISIINNNKSVVTCVPNYTNVKNSLESFNFNNKHYYNIDDNADHEELEHDDNEDDEEIERCKKLLDHIQNGCCNNLHTNTNENLELLLASKLQSLWTLKQTIRGQGGIGYLLNVQLDDETTGGKSFEKFKIRTSNCLLHGLFKGFLIEIEHVDELMSNLHKDKNQMIMRFTRSISLIKALINDYNFPNGNLCFNVLSDSKLDYLSDLCQQYCDALQF